MSTFTTYKKSGATATYPIVTPTFSNYSLSFPGGTGNYCLTSTYPMDDLAGDDVSFSCWFKWHEGHPEVAGMVFSTSTFIFAPHHGAFISFNAANKKIKSKLQIGFLGAEVESTTDIDGSDWWHIAVTMDRDSVSYIYINGVQEDSSSTTTEFDFDTTVSATLGAAAYGLNVLSEANIDDFAIWNTELTSADVTKIYNGGKPTDLTQSASYDSDKSSDLLVYWKMEENTGSTIADSSGNGHTLSKAASVSFSSDVPS